MDPGAPASFPVVDMGTAFIGRVATKRLSVSNVNTGGGRMRVQPEVVEGGNWLTLGSTAAVLIGAGRTASVLLRADTSKLFPGKYEGTVRLCAPSAGPEILVHVRINVRQPTATDLVFVIDTTSSMSDSIDAVKADATHLIDRLTARDPGARLGIVLYKDYPDQDSAYVARTLLPFTTDAAAAIAAIGRITVAGGGDLEEAMFSGIEMAINGTGGLGAWRGGDVQKQIIVMGDAPPHDPEPNTGYTEASVSQDAFNADPVNISTVPLGGDPDVVDAFGALARDNGGAMVPADRADDLVGSLLSQIDLVTAPVASAPTDPRGLIGRFSGSAGKSTAAVDVTGRTLASLTATFEVGGATVAGTMQGYVLPSGQFLYTLRDAGRSVTFKGVVGADHRQLTGTLALRAPGKHVSGKASVTRTN